jgi:putative ABC transport system permease protein
MRLGEQRSTERTLAWLESVLSDVRFGVRMLRKNATVTAAALISLALGTGACIAAFSVLDALILRPLPVREPNRLVQLTYPTEVPGVDGDMFSQPLLERFRSATSARIELFGVSYQGIRPAIFSDSGQEEQVRAQWVSGNMFETLGVRAATGRTLTPADDSAGTAQWAAVLSHPFWLRRFAGDPGVVGKWFTFPGSDRRFQIVGVTEVRFAGIERGRLTDLWVPVTTWNARAPDKPWWEMPWWDWVRIFGRLKPGVEVAGIQAELHATFSNFRRERAFSADEPRERVERYVATPLQVRSAAAGPSSLQRQFARPLWILMLVVTLVFVIAGSNVGNLFFARAIAREHEMSLRLSVGASRGRLVQQVLIETGLIALGAAFAGWLFASIAAPAIVQMLTPSGSPVYADLENDWRRIAFVMAIAVVTTGLFGLAPALRASGVAPMGVIKEASSRVMSGARVLRPLAGLQIAFSLVVLFMAGLFASSFSRLSRVDVGFPTENLLIVTVEGRPTADAERDRLSGKQLVDAVRRIPRIERAALSGWVPFRFSGEGSDLTTRLRVPGSSDILEAHVQRAAPGFFETVGIRLVEGRTFGPQDAHASPVPVIVNEAFARRLAGTSSAVGQRVGRIEERAIVQQEIVGVVTNARSGDLRQPAPPTIYDLFAGTAPIQTLLVRASGDPGSLGSEIRRQVPLIAPSFQVTDVVLQSTLVDDALLRERVLALLSGFLAIVGLVLAAVGLYGVLSYSVVQRTRDIGIRLALGADPQRVGRFVIADIGRVIAAGMVVGLAGGLLLAPRFASLLYEVQPLDWWSIVAPVGSLSVAALIAVGPPAWRASHIDPVMALRNEPWSMWQAARLTVRKAMRELSQGGEPPIVPISTLITEFAGSVRQAKSFPEVIQVALSTLRERTGAQTIMLLEKVSDEEYRSDQWSIPAQGFLLNRLKHSPHPLPLTDGDFEVWLRWARELRPDYTVEIEKLGNTGARIAVPLRTKQEIVGVLLLGPPDGRDSYTASERQILSGSAELLALMIENAGLTDRAVEQEKLLRDLALAAEVQKRLLPPHPPRAGAVTLAAFTLPARTVGGDYYDFLDLGRERIGIAVADVAGKGVAAALLMSGVQASLRVISADPDVGPSQLATRMNGFLYRSTAANKYATFFYAQVEERGRRLRYVNAGHNPPYLVRRANGTVEIVELCAGGTVLGLFPEVEYQEAEIDLRAGDLLVVFTDGVTDALNTNGEEFGDERLKDLLRRAVGAGAEDVSSKLADTMHEWIGGAEQHDDLTFVVATVN